MTDAARSAGVTPLRYPGYNPSGPYTWPSPNPAEPLSQRRVVGGVLRCNEPMLEHYNVCRDVRSLLYSAPMQFFALDAFWWIFLQHFAAVDFELLASRNQRSTLVTQADVATYMALPAGGAPLPKRPMKRDSGSTGLDAQRTEATREFPPHLCVHRGRLRDEHDIVRTATPSLRSSSAASLRDAVCNVAGTTPLQDADDACSVASSANHSPRSVESNGTRLSDLSAASAATLDGLLRITNFNTTFPSLSKLAPEVLPSVVAREQHQLFTRMSTHYAQSLQAFARKHYTVKDAVTRMLPDLLAQILFSAFWQCAPYATQLFDEAFQRDLAKVVSFWVGGVERLPNPRQWPIHVLLDTVYKKLSDKRFSSLGTSHGAPRISSVSRRLKQTGQVRGVRLPSLTVGNPVLAVSPKSAAPDPKGQSTEPLTPRHTPRAPKNPPATARGVAHHTAPDQSPTSRMESDGLTPDERRARAVEIDVAQMRHDLHRLTTTHTFSQVHYAATHKGRAEGMNTKVPERVANVYQLGPQKRTVQVIKAELDAKYIPIAPWYADHRSKVRIRDQATETKFALHNWSPLLHRFMLSNGAPNHGNAHAIHWTL